MEPLTELGVGVVYSPSLEPLIEGGGDLIQVLEIEPQPYWVKQSGQPPSYYLDERAFDRILHWPQKKIVHGVGIPVGGSLGLDEGQIAPFMESVSRLNPEWVSEHLSFLRADSPQGPYHTGFLLPPLQSLETVTMAVRNIRQFKSKLLVPFAFENAPNYLRPIPQELPDGEFLARIAEDADCGILLDMHNLWCNEINGRQPVGDVLASLPLDRVWEVHLAGGDDYRGYWLDAHSGLIPEKLIEVCFEWFPKLPNLKAIIFEIIPDYIAAKSIETDALLGQLNVLQTLWKCRGQNAPDDPTPRVNLGSDIGHGNLPMPRDWEHALGSLVNKRSPRNDLQVWLSDDPGIGVLQHLVTSVRSGMFVDLLTLSYRLMVLHLGEAPVREIMEAYWNQTLPEPFAAEETERFAGFIRDREIPVPHLNEVLAYEVASLELLKTGKETVVNFSCHPAALLEALRTGKLPDQLPLGRYEAVVQYELGIDKAV